MDALAGLRWVGFSCVQRVLWVFTISALVKFPVEMQSDF
jgi:hypothetical protein